MAQGPAQEMPEQLFPHPPKQSRSFLKADGWGGLLFRLRRNYTPHSAVDTNTGRTMASTLTGNDIGDPSQVAPLLDTIGAPIASVTSDGAYDGMPTCDVVDGQGENISVVLPLHLTAILSDEAGYNPSQRD
jgi:hypothetical protein